METNASAPAHKIARLGRKVLYWFTAIMIVTLAIFVYYRFYFVFGDGVKSGQLNFIVHKGYIFKTYEGRMIQVGYRSQTGGMQSNEFEFSVTDEAVAKELQMQSGKVLDLHYKEYKGRLPWRGMSTFVVDRIERVHDASTEQTPPVEFPNNGQ